MAISLKNGFVLREVSTAMRFSSITVDMLLFVYPVAVTPWQVQFCASPAEHGGEICSLALALK